MTPRTLLLLLAAATLSLSACSSDVSTKSATVTSPAESQPAPAASTKAAPGAKGQPLAAPVPGGRAVATFAGGCFWCMEPPFEKLDGVDAVLSGYTGGPEQRPTYKQVSSGKTGHTEAVRVIYDPAKVKYEVLVQTFWRSMNPTDAGGQFADRGSQYRPAIYTHSEAQVVVATASKQALEASKKFDKPIVVPILPAEDFWVAEEYHQDFYKKNYAHYSRYAAGSGRKGFLAKLWGAE